MSLEKAESYLKEAGFLDHVIELKESTATFALFGGVCLVVGAFFCHPAAGWFMAGIVLVAAAVILSRGGDQA